MKVKTLFATLCLGTAITAQAQHDKSENMNEGDAVYLLTGSYATADEEALKVYRFNEQTGEAEYISGLRGIANPSFLTSSADGERIYAVSEDNGKNPAANAISFDKKEERLTFLSSQPSGGGLPCYVTLSPDKRFALTANYMGGSITVYPLDKEGRLLPDTHLISFSGSGPNKERQEMPHLHCVAFTPDGKYLVANDLGTDRMYMFPVNAPAADGTAVSLLNETERLDIQMESGSGPRHICFHPNGKFAYLISELSGKITVFAYQDGEMKRLQTIVCDPFVVDGSADIHVSADGRFLYASKRLKEDGIVIYSINPQKGTLTQVGFQPTGLYPRIFELSPNGRYLISVCRDGGRVQIFERNADTGLLKDTGKTIKLNKPACVHFLDTDKRK